MTQEQAHNNECAPRWEVIHQAEAGIAGVKVVPISHGAGNHEGWRCDTGSASVGSIDEEIEKIEIPDVGAGSEGVGGLERFTDKERNHLLITSTM